MEYFLKKLSKIHYTALVALSPISWGISFYQNITESRGIGPNAVYF